MTCAVHVAVSRFRRFLTKRGLTLISRLFQPCEQIARDKTMYTSVCIRKSALYVCREIATKIILKP